MTFLNQAFIARNRLWVERRWDAITGIFVGVSLLKMLQGWKAHSTSSEGRTARRPRVLTDERG